MLCLQGVPPSTYIKSGGGGGGRPPMARPMRSPTPTGSRTPPIQVGVGEEKEGREGEKERGAPPPPCPIRTRGGGGARPALAAPPLLHFGPMRPINPPGGSDNPSGTPVKSRFHPEHFRYPNICFQYINLHVSTISRLLVMSVISFGTPNKLWYIKTHKLII